MYKWAEKKGMYNRDPILGGDRGGATLIEYIIIMVILVKPPYSVCDNKQSKLVMISICYAIAIHTGCVV